jgi:hypothetical protein
MERTAAYCHLHRSAKHTANGTSCGSAVAVVKGDCTLIASSRAARLPILPVRTPESLWFQSARLYLESHHPEPRHKEEKLTLTFHRNLLILLGKLPLR